MRLFSMCALSLAILLITELQDLLAIYYLTLLHGGNCDVKISTPTYLHQVSVLLERTVAVHHQRRQSHLPEWEQLHQ